MRLVVAVPEALVGAMVKGARMAFTVPAYPGQTFYGVVSLMAHDLDEKTRTMAVELDVKNPDVRLGAGMYPEVPWPIKRPQPSLLVPPTSIITHDRADVCDSREGRRGAMGERESRGARRRPDRSLRVTEGGRHGRSAWHRRDPGGRESQRPTGKNK